MNKDALMMCCFMGALVCFSLIMLNRCSDLTYKCSRYGTEYVQSSTGLALSIDGSGYPVKCKPEVKSDRE